MTGIIFCQTCRAHACVYVCVFLNYFYFNSAGVLVFINKFSDLITIRYFGYILLGHDILIFSY